MKQTICDVIYEAVKKYNPAIFTPWKDLGFQDFEDMLNQIKTNFQVAIWALTELEHYSDWESDFVVDTTNNEYEIPIYKVGDITFIVECPPYDGDFIIKPVKKVTKTVVQSFWKEDNTKKFKLC